MFNKAVIFSDLHFGRSGNSPIANKDNLNFLEWAIDEAKTWGATQCFMLGDWFNNRNSIGVASFNAALSGLEMVSAAFEKSWFISGNHDLFFRDRRDITSIEFAKHIPNIYVVNDPFTIDEVTFLPWLMPGEDKTLDLRSRYVFAHLELSGFMTNTRYTMPDTEHSQKADSFVNQEYCFTGHFHQRQFRKNVCYIGNAMGFDFSDDGDPDRGIMLLEYGKEPIFKTWPQQPLYSSMNLSEILDRPEKLLRQNMTVRANIDVVLSYEEAQEIRDVLTKSFSLRKLELVNGKLEEEEFNDTNVQFHTVDQIVIAGLESVQSSELSPARLIQIYNTLRTKS